MVVFLVIFALLLLWILIRRIQKGKFFTGKEELKIILIILMTNTLGMVIYNSDQNQTGLKRNGYGKGQRIESFIVTVDGILEEELIEIMVEERQYDQEQAQELLDQAVAGLEQLILGENQSLDRVEADLNLLTQIPDTAITVSWELDRYDILTATGEIQEDKVTEEGVLVELTGTLTCQEETVIHTIPVMVYPRKKTTREAVLEQLNKSVQKKSEETRQQEMMQLPQELDGKPILWKHKTESRGYIILLLGIAGAFATILLKKQNEEKAIKERRQQLLLDYPEIVNQLTLLLGAGMPIKSAWEKVVSDYQKYIEKTRKRAAYEEMRQTCIEMKSGIAEREAYERMGRRIGLAPYMKLGVLLSQNLRKGTKGLKELLDYEAANAFEERKSLAKRLGEEAGTKLLMPMFLMLLVVLLIVVIPAFMSVQI